MGRKHFVLGVLFGLVASIPASSVSAGEGEDSVAAQMYRKYCAACHGSEGKGDGFVSGFLQPHPTDLTQLANRHGGKFPFAYVMRAIDGRETVRGHGAPDQPVWGEILKEEAADESVADTEVRGKILLITEYLRSIQAQPGEAEPAKPEDAEQAEPESD